MRFLTLLLALLAACSDPAPRHDEHRQPYHAYHRFERAEDWVARFEDPSRDTWQKPADVIRVLALAPSARVADIGAGTGYFAVRLARAVPDGRVFAVDIEASMVEYVTERAKREGLANIEGVLASPEDPKIPEPVDLIFIVDTYHHLADRIAYFRRLTSTLKPAGRIAIIDFTPESTMGPIEKVAPAKVIGELSEAGYVLMEQPAILPEQYFLIFAVAQPR